jgi:polar amino acid transport system substrate-binding protein
VIRRCCAVVALVVALCGCGTKPEVYRVGVDPSWYPLDLAGKTNNVYAFTNELLQEIARVEKVSFQRLNLSWDNLVYGLKGGDYDAILSTLQPSVLNGKTFMFSQLFLQTGAVIIVQEGDRRVSLTDFKGQLLSIPNSAEEIQLMAKHPLIESQYYTSVSVALDDLSASRVGGVLVPLIPAETYVKNIYPDSLRIVGPPLLDDGLRMISLKSHDKVVKVFNRGLNRLKSNGTYSKLLDKWQLTSDFQS